VTIIVDAKSFEAIGVQKVEEQPVQLPVLKDVKLGEALRKLAAQVKGDGPFQGTAVPCRDFVEITVEHVQLAKKEALSGDHLDELWESLASASPTEALLAAQTLSAVPGQIVPWLRDRVKPAKAPVVPEAALVAQYLKDLESDKFAVRQKAAEELEKLGPPVLPALRERLEKKPPLEVARRLEDLIKRLDRPADELRTLRALRVLEKINSPEARQLLEAMAKGAANARPTEEAKEALKRLGSSAAK
jgi:hypothetical protein